MISLKGVKQMPAPFAQRCQGKNRAIFELFFSAGAISHSSVVTGKKGKKLEEEQKQRKEKKNILVT